jgi:hypothetical protein
VSEVVDDINPPSNNYKDSSPGKDKDKHNSISEETKKSSAADLSEEISSSNISTAVTPSRQFEVVQADGQDGLIQSSNQIFQPSERCLRVLEKIWDDPYSQSFQEPVDTSLYDDYLEIVEEPISLRDVRNKIEAGEYRKFGQYTKFANDMRKIWRNCKTYNLYKSQIWHCAHALSMMFERLYQAWVVSFSDGSVSLSDPIGNPWETSCRACLKEVATIFF